jgi:hypothetical protein
VTVPSVHQYPRQGGQHKRGDSTAKADHTEKEGGTRQPVYQPVNGDLLHPGADKRDALTAKEETVISMAQGTENDFETLWITIHKEAACPFVKLSVK